MYGKKIRLWLRLRNRTFDGRNMEAFGTNKYCSQSGLQNPQDRGTAGPPPKKKIDPAENVQNWKTKKKNIYTKKVQI